MKVNYEPNPSSAIIIKRKKGLSVSNQQLKVNIFCWALFDPFTFEDSMKEGAQLMFSKNYEDKAWPCNQIKSCVSWPSGCKTFQTHENKEKSFRSVWKVRILTLIPLIAELEERRIQKVKLSDYEDSNLLLIASLKGSTARKRKEIPN